MAAHFLRCLSRIQQTASDTSVASRSRRIRRAAYASMAYSAGHRRAWSRALLRKLRCRRARPVILPRRPRIARPQVVIEIDRAEVLRKLVPGGTGMDYCRLLEETADYIRCLTTQGGEKRGRRRRRRRKGEVFFTSVGPSRAGGGGGGGSIDHARNGCFVLSKAWTT
ncbi:transcription factor IBH1-like [Musa acuminata AAA Group]|uniref:transcription factor IBH1-like n=1 Tax=Musa acuminata AAA Group TaxID=214697 RepID=UPI0031E1FD2F